MKKIHLVAAVTALLLSGGVFVKTNQENQLLDTNLEALTATEIITWWEAPGTGDGYYRADDAYATQYDYSNPNHPKAIQTMITRTCEPANFWCRGPQFTKIIIW